MKRVLEMSRNPVVTGSSGFFPPLAVLSSANKELLLASPHYNSEGSFLPTSAPKPVADQQGRVAFETDFRR